MCANQKAIAPDFTVSPLKIIMVRIALLFSSLCFIAFALTNRLPAKCAGKVRVRAEWRDLNKAQQDLYVKALQCVYTSKNIEKYVSMHNINMGMKSWHFNAHFLPVHRAFVYDFETDVLKCEPEVMFQLYYEIINL